ncbi:hypothetical protein LZ31DRAFT_509798 [Colletotrichum somersetense]|nr:hypothetical protein LZ31DRAFT_509798 [Colletotrichum somersetense]
MEPTLSSSLGGPSTHLDSSHEGQVKLPGFGLPLNALPDGYLTVTHLDWINWPHTIRERCMVAFLEEVTLAKDWPSKVFDNDEIARWKADLFARDWEKSSNIQYGDFTETMFRYCMDELREKAKLYQETGIVTVLDINLYLARSDRAISQDLLQSLKEATGALESTRTCTEKYNHGDSIGTTVDIIDPDLYALFYGHSKALSDKEIGLQNCAEHSGMGILIPEPSESDRKGKLKRPFDPDAQHIMIDYSAKSQWLPCNVQFPDGNNARITSYVNNLHPRDHADVYSLLEKVITQAMPLWRLVYDGVYERDEPLQMRINYSGSGWKYKDGPPEDLRQLMQDYYDKLVPEDEWQERYLAVTDAELGKVLDKPEPSFGPEWRDNDRKSSRQRTSKITADKNRDMSNLQVIVKLSALHLTPESPICGTDNEWTLDGVPNDHICATVVYVFDNDNVTDAKISFRSRFERSSLQIEDLVPAEEIYGFVNNGPSVQEIGTVTLREGSMLAYPNVLQHRWSSTRLKDPTKPGHRKVLTLHVVDPRVKILSTANVPPQQADWWLRELSNKVRQFNRLPNEVVDMVLDGVVECPFPMKEAIRLKSMAVEERNCIARQVVDALNLYHIWLYWETIETDSEDGEDSEDSEDGEDGEDGEDSEEEEPGLVDEAGL